MSNNKSRPSSAAPFSNDDMPSLPGQIKQDPNKILLGGHFLPVKIDKKATKKQQQNKPNAKKADDNKVKISSKGAILKPGRHYCNCEGELHDVITNCLQCGKIVCEQEKLGACLFCGHEVNLPTVYESKSAATSSKINPELLRAVEHRNKLIEYDKTFEERTIVIDDHVDFDESTTNMWLSQEERDERKQQEDKLQELTRDERKKLVFTFDFAGRRVLVDNSKSEEELVKLMQDMSKSSAISSASKNQQKKQPQQEDLDEGNVKAHPGVLKNKIKYTAPSSGKKKKGNKNAAATVAAASNEDDDDSKWAQQQYRVQHEYFTIDEDNDHEMNSLEGRGLQQDEPVDEIKYDKPSKDENDQGMCLSMHQPWASLLVHGIMRHEGRDWPTDHKGRLWIASTREKPTPELVQEVELKYKDLGRRGFPKFYPTGVLLGCVDVSACLNREQYLKQYKEKDAESGSDYVFICKNPRRLVVPLSILGNPGVYPLEKDTVMRAHLGLKPLPAPPAAAAK